MNRWLEAADRAAARVREVALPAGDDRRPGVSSVESVTRALEAAQADRTGAFVELLPERALAAARRADAEPPRGPLHGVPIAVKDNIDVAGVATRNGTAGLGHRVPERDASVVRLLEDAGAVVIAKTRLHELAWGMTTPGCGNPHDLSRSAGGSSGGSAAAVAAGVVEMALGTDTGGSIRNPAALCGIAGLRPTWGTIPMDGITPLAPSQDTVGPLARTVAGCAAVFAALSGRSVDYPGTADLRVARPGARVWRDRVTPAVAAKLDQAAESLNAVHLELPRLEVAPSVSLLVILAESAEIWADRPGEVSEEVTEVLDAGRAVRATDYVRARNVAGSLRALVVEGLAAASADLLLMPTVPVTATPRTATTVEVNGRTETIGAVFSRLTSLAAVTGLPALTVPAGTDDAGLPIGAQLIGPPHSEALLCAAGARIESAVAP